MTIKDFRLMISNSKLPKNTKSLDPFKVVILNEATLDVAK